MHTITTLELQRLLAQMRQEDPTYRVFGVNEHRYHLHPPVPTTILRAFEMEQHIVLPADYRHFLATIGNGGAGPHYGVTAFDSAREQGTCHQPFPFMPNERPTPHAIDQWVADGMPGVLELAPRGCCCYCYIVVHGPSYGTVWDGVDELHLTGRSFTDWYRRWLDWLTSARDVLQRGRALQGGAIGRHFEEVMRHCASQWQYQHTWETTCVYISDLALRFELDHDGRVMKTEQLIITGMRQQ